MRELLAENADKGRGEVAMLAWMLYVIMVTLLLSVGAYVAERAARLKRGGTRWIWLARDRRVALHAHRHPSRCNRGCRTC